MTTRPIGDARGERRKMIMRWPGVGGLGGVLYGYGGGVVGIMPEEGKLTMKEIRVLPPCYEGDRLWPGLGGC